MGEVIQLMPRAKPERFAHPADAPTLGELRLSDAELDRLARRAGEIAVRRAFIDADFAALLRIQALERAFDALSGTDDDDLADAVARRRREILGALGL